MAIFMQETEVRQHRCRDALERKISKMAALK